VNAAEVEAGQRYLALADDLAKEQRAIQRFHSQRARLKQERKTARRRAFVAMKACRHRPSTLINVRQARGREHRPVRRTTRRARSRPRPADDDELAPAGATA
jgi:hypothetical protein